MSAYIVDNSVWWKAPSFPGIATRLHTVSTQDLILTCPPQVLEYCHSAQSPAEHDVFRQNLAEFFAADQHPDNNDVLSIQSALWNGGYFRGAGAFDILIAAYAIVNDAIVLTADHDYDHIAAVVPELKHEYVPER